MLAILTVDVSVGMMMVTVWTVAEITDRERNLGKLLLAVFVVSNISFVDRTIGFKHLSKLWSLTIRSENEGSLFFDNISTERSIFTLKQACALPQQP